MQAIHFDGKQLSYRQDLDEPLPPAGEALIRPTRMGICSTDLELIKGYMDFRGVLGHEFVGVVEEAPGEKGRKWVGKRVVGSINCVRSLCDMCRAGMREHARDRSVLGIKERDGCFADRFCLPIENLFEVPAHVDDDVAVFTEPLAAAYQVLRQITIENRPYVTVLGDGRLGMLCAQVLAKENATVRLVGKHADKLEVCAKWGIKHRLLSDVGLRADQDIVIDATGSASGLVTAMAMVRPRGRIVLKTTVSPGSPAIDLSPIVVNEIQVIGSRCGPFDVALEALASEAIDVVSLISKRYKLRDAQAAFAAARSPGVIKVLLEP